MSTKRNQFGLTSTSRPLAGRNTDKPLKFTFAIFSFSNQEPESRRERYLTPSEQSKLMEVLVDDLAFLRAPIEVSLGTGVRKPKASFKVTGEQIDGAFTFQSTDFLLEANWQKNLVEASDLDSLAGKLTRKLDTRLASIWRLMDTRKTEFVSTRLGGG